MSDRVYIPRGTVGDHGDKFDLKCHKCGAWYTASCHWYTVHDKVTYQLRDKELKPLPWKDKQGNLHYEESVSMIPRIVVENISAHECARGKAKYDV